MKNCATICIANIQNSVIFQREGIIKLIMEIILGKLSNHMHCKNEQIRNFQCFIKEKTILILKNMQCKYLSIQSFFDYVSERRHNQAD